MTALVQAAIIDTRQGSAANDAAGIKLGPLDNVCNVTGKITPKVFIISMVSLTNSRLQHDLIFSSLSQKVRSGTAWLRMNVALEILRLTM